MEINTVTCKSGVDKGEVFKYTFKNGVTFTPPKGTYPRYTAETLKRWMIIMKSGSEKMGNQYHLERLSYVILKNRSTIKNIMEI